MTSILIIAFYIIHQKFADKRYEKIFKKRI
jgi:hypothetical protein